MLPRGYMVISVLVPNSACCRAYERHYLLKFDENDCAILWPNFDSEIVWSINMEYHGGHGIVNLQGKFIGMSLVLDDYNDSNYLGTVPILSEKGVRKFARDIGEGLLDELANFIKRRTEENRVLVTQLVGKVELKEGNDRGGLRPRL